MKMRLQKLVFKIRECLTSKLCLPQFMDESMGPFRLYVHLAHRAFSSPKGRSWKINGSSLTSRGVLDLLPRGDN